MNKIKELQSLTTPKVVYTSFIDLTARAEIEELKKNGAGNGSGQNPSQGADLTNVQTILRNVMTIIRAQVEDETGTPQAYNTDISGLAAECDALIAGLTGSGGEAPEEPDQPEKTLVSISAAYSGGEVAVGMALTELDGITVTATYSDGSTAVVAGYTLSGEIAEGSNTITVSYGGKTATVTVVGVASGGEDSVKVYGVGLPWVADIGYGQWSANGCWYETHYSETAASLQVGNGFTTNRRYSKPVDGNAYKYFRVPTNEGQQYAVSNNVTFYGCDSPDALTEAGHPVTKCSKKLAFVPCDFAADRDTEGMAILYPMEQFDYYYIQYDTSNSMTGTYPDLLGIFDANILENPLANPTE